MLQWRRLDCRLAKLQSRCCCLEEVQRGVSHARVPVFAEFRAIRQRMASWVEVTENSGRKDSANQQKHRDEDFHLEFISEE